MPEKFTLYLETTIPSYLAAHPSRDLIVAAHQQITHDWWQQARANFDISISEAVLDEIGAGDQDASAQREVYVEDLPVLALTDEVSTLASEYLSQLGLPQHAHLDALHLAYTVVHQIDYLLTWNCKHLANGVIIQRLQVLNTSLGRHTPIIVTPEELLEFPESEGA